MAIFNLFVYGALEKGGQFHSCLEGLSSQRAKIRGRLELGPWYPKLHEGEDIIVGELYQVTGEVLQKIDEVQGYLPSNPEESLYIRKAIELLEPQGARAFAYYFNGSSKWY